MSCQELGDLVIFLVGSVDCPLEMPIIPLPRKRRQAVGSAGARRPRGLRGVVDPGPGGPGSLKTRVNPETMRAWADPTTAGKASMTPNNP